MCNTGVLQIGLCVNQTWRLPHCCVASFKFFRNLASRDTELCLFKLAIALRMKEKVGFLHLVELDFFLNKVQISLWQAE
jgi:hypothetical protein